MSTFKEPEAGLEELERWRQELREALIKCLVDKGVSETELKGIMAVCVVSGAGGIGGIIACLAVAGIEIEMILDCYRRALAKVGNPPYDENNGSAKRNGDGYDVEVWWRWSNRTWPVDNEVHWVYKIHNNSKDPNNYITSIKLVFPNSIEDLFDQTEIPDHVTIMCNGNKINARLWRRRIQGDTLIFEVEPGFEELAGLKKCCTVRLDMHVEADGTTELGTVHITVDRGKDHHWGQGVAAPGPKLTSIAVARTQYGKSLPPELAIRPEYLGIASVDIANLPPNALVQINESVAATLRETFGIRTIRDLVTLQYLPAMRTARRLLREAQMRKADSKYLSPQQKEKGDKRTANKSEKERY